MKKKKKKKRKKNPPPPKKKKKNADKQKKTKQLVSPQYHFFSLIVNIFCQILLSCYEEACSTDWDWQHNPTSGTTRRQTHLHPDHRLVS